MDELSSNHAEVSGGNARPDMVFNKNQTGIDDALVMADFISKLKEL